MTETARPDVEALKTALAVSEARAAAAETKASDAEAPVAWKNHKPEETVSILRQAEVLHCQSTAMESAIPPRALETMAPPSWPLGSAALRRSPSLATDPSMN